MSRDLELHYRESGHADGEPIIFLHGLFASLQNWQSIVKNLNDTYRIINIDLPNHGSSPHTERFSFEECILAIVGLNERLGLDKSTYIGHSLGGKIAMLMALQFPNMVESLVVEDIAPKSYPPWFSTAMRAMQELNLFEIQSRKDADERLSQTLPDKDLRAFLLTNLQRTENGFRWRVNIEALIASGKNISGFPESKQQFYGECLFIAGGDSVYIEQEDHELIRSYFPHAKIETFEGADHWVHAREVQKFSDRIKTFLD